MNYRIEKDSMGEIKVPKDAYWGAQTQRSLENFAIGDRLMPEDIIHSFAIIKMACALTNNDLGKLDNRRTKLITKVCQEILDGKLDGNFPLVVYQTGSGTQSNMNVNEVVANRANELGKGQLIHPNDHVNMSQSSNDTFPAAMHIAALMALENHLLPEAEALAIELEFLEEKYQDVIKMGRTHMQDATPITLGQEISGWRSMIEHDVDMIRASEESLRELALGGTAVGTGLNAPKNFDKKVAKHISKITGLSFYPADNKFQSLTSKDGLVFSHGALKALAADLFKIANDIRMLASGPRCGIGELIIPENEPGSSIMPGKVNPTQCEAVTMVSTQVMGNDVAIGIAASQGHYELNVFMPVLIDNYLESAHLLGDVMRSFRINCVAGIQVNQDRIDEYRDRSLMLVTALSPHIGYDKAAEIAKYAHKKGLTLKEAALKLGYVTEREFDKYVDPGKMV